MDTTKSPPKAPHSPTDSFSRSPTLVDTPAAARLAPSPARHYWRVASAFLCFFIVGWADGGTVIIPSVLGLPDQSISDWSGFARVAVSFPAQLHNGFHVIHDRICRVRSVQLYGDILTRATDMHSQHPSCSSSHMFWVDSALLLRGDPSFLLCAPLILSPIHLPKDVI